MNEIVPTEKKNGFLKRPEDKLGAVVLAGFAGLGIYAWGSIVPFLLTAAENTLHLAVVVAALVIMGFVLFDPNWRRLLFYIYRSAMRWLVGQFISIDPIGVQKTYLERFKEKLGELDQGLSEVRGQRGSLKKRIDKNQTDYEQCLARADVAQRNKDPRMYTLETRQEQRLGHLLGNQKQSLSRLDFIVKVLSRYREVCTDEITDISRDIDVRVQEQAEAKAFRKGMSAAKAILKGLPEKDMYDESTAVLEDRYSKAIGEVEQLMDVTKDIISSADIDDEAATKMMDQKLSAWRNRDAGMSLGKTNKAEIISTADSQSITIAPREAVPVLRQPSDDEDWRKLFS